MHASNVATNNAVAIKFNLETIEMRQRNISHLLLEIDAGSVRLETIRHGLRRVASVGPSPRRRHRRPFVAVLETQQSSLFSFLFIGNRYLNGEILAAVGRLAHQSQNLTMAGSVVDGSVAVGERDVSVGVVVHQRRSRRLQRAAINR